MRIRLLTNADIPALVEIDRASFAADDQYDLRYYNEVIASDAFEAIGVEDETSCLVAWSLIDVRGEPIRIRSLAVHPKCRRRGFATALVNAALSEHGTSDLLVDPHNIAAIALYEKLGFVADEPDPELPARIRMVHRSG